MLGSMGGSPEQVWEKMEGNSEFQSQKRMHSNTWPKQRKVFSDIAFRPGQLRTIPEYQPGRGGWNRRTESSSAVSSISEEAARADGISTT